jgi:glycogen phosphorylase
MSAEMLVAYFSMEFAVDDRLPIYAGGLGVLAGDHLRSASDLGVPIVGVGLLYRQGYFRQVIDDEGRQREEYPDTDPEPVGLVREPVSVEVELGEETVGVDVWLDVGSVPLYLLESDAIVPRFYTIDREERIRQEVVIGVGGVRALAALGHEPTVFHLNEGHAAFAALERRRALLEGEGLSLDEALEHVRATTVFTTHTPVPEGNEVFEPELARRYLGRLVERSGLSWDFLETDGQVGLTPLALKTAAYANGVSELHGEVSREMWPGFEIGAITNGAHAPTWMASALRQGDLDDEKIGRVHVERKRELVDFVRARTGKQLDPDLLTLGFKRRFATYKRATLLFSEPDRLAALPVQVVVSGKAHPADEAGKELIAQINAFAREPRFADRVVFLPNYDMEIAAHVTSGSDVWVNTPRRPMEASGTSGMKAGMNGVLNLSVLDGWWPEAYSPEIGWAIQGGSDEEDAAELYRLLEDEAVPIYRDDRPRWLAMMKASIERVSRDFTSDRMLTEYVERYYAPASKSGRRPRTS